jgi:hypothetical protein
VVFCLVLMLAAAGASRFEHVTPDVVRMLLLFGVGVFVIGLVVDLTTVPASDWTVVGAHNVNPAGQDTSLNRDVRMLENHLSSRDVDPVLQHRLTVLTQARLSELGLSRGVAGVDARLGPTLCEVLDGPPRRLSRDTLAECIRRIEELTP